jgi:hypothetical protein
MIDLIASSMAILNKAGLNTEPLSLADRSGIAFESHTVLGFLLAYDNPDELIAHWDQDSTRLVAMHQLALRRAGVKAWNTYTVFLTSGRVDQVRTAALTAIEEDLSGTRKIVRASINDLYDLHSALLTLLPLQSAPHLEAVNMAEEIRQRTTELQPRAVDAFLSSAEESLVIQVLEEEP